MNSQPRHLCQILTLIALLLATPAWAEWKTVQQVSLGTAQVLEKGAGNFGVFAPLAYGITNRLTLETHPVYDLLLTVNLNARYRIVESQRWVLSATGDFRQSFYSGTHAPGDLALGAMATFYVNDAWALTAGLKYAAILNPQTCYHQGFPQPTCVDAVDGQIPGVDNGVAGTLTAHWLVTPHDLLELTGTLRVRLAPVFGRETPTVTAVWVHDFGRVHLMAGATAGEFFIGRMDVLGLADPGQNPSFYVTPVMPVVDAWFRF
jgi:hypothetical protein